MSTSRKRVAPAAAMDTQQIVSLPDLNFFTEKSVQLSIESSELSELSPSNVYNPQSTIQFDIPAQTQTFLSPEFWIFARVRIVQADGSDLADAADVALVANATHSLFSDVELKIGNTVLSGRHGLYSYEAYINSIFMSSSSAKNYLDGISQLYRDTLGKHDTLTDANAGFDQRKTAAGGSKWMELYFMLHTPLSEQKRLLLPTLGCQISLTPNKDAFRIMSAAPGGHKLQIETIRLHTQRITVNSRLYISILQALQTMPARYPYRRVRMISFEKTTGTSQIDQPLVVNGLLPKVIFMMPVTADRYHGAYAKSPYKITIAGLKSAYIKSEGKIYPNVIYDLDSENNYLTRAFAQLQKSTGFFNSPFASDITYNDFKSGYGLICFDLSRSQKAGITGAPSMGSASVHLNYSSALFANITYIFYLVYDSNFYVDSLGQTSVDYLVNL